MFSSQISITEIVDKHGSSWSNIRKYQLNREKIEKNLPHTTFGTTRPAKLKYPQVDAAMSNLVQEMINKGGNISGRLLRYTAQKYAMKNNIDGSGSGNGWLQKFSQRHDLDSGVLQGKVLNLSMIMFE